MNRVYPSFSYKRTPYLEVFFSENILYISIRKAFSRQGLVEFHLLFRIMNIVFREIFPYLFFFSFAFVQVFEKEADLISKIGILTYECDSYNTLGFSFPLKCCYLSFERTSMISPVLYLLKRKRELLFYDIFPESFHEKFPLYLAVSLRKRQECADPHVTHE